MPDDSPRFQQKPLDYWFQAENLQQLDRNFLETLCAARPEAHRELLAYRQAGELPAPRLSALLLTCAPLLESFLGEFFEIKTELEREAALTLVHNPVFAFKKWFVLRRARRFRPKNDEIADFSELDAWLDGQLAETEIAGDRELAVAKLGLAWLEHKTEQAEHIEQLTRWCFQALNTSEGRAATRDWVSFRLPTHTDHGHLVPLRPVPDDPLQRLEGLPGQRRQREGFKLTDARMSAREVLGEVNYCIYCHDHQGDFCSRGFPEKKGEPELGLRVDPLGVTLTGCPLDEKISEMHHLKRDGYLIAPLAVVMADNPMCPVTGHRICNDCMKACIYQKQSPVDIPQIETRVLTDVLALPWGVEIYDLLTRWNPLRPRQYLPKPYNGLKILVAGLGPAGFTLAHHLLMEGCAVVGVDGLKIEALPRPYLETPQRDWRALCEELDERIMAGFGGVAEYGITVRWDKNFLKLIYLGLARRPYFQAHGGVRFGGTLTVEDAWQLGFDHLSVAVGAGLPQALPIPGSLAPGMRQANDFLMALQLTGAARRDSLANLQVRLPAVVIGGGLTGVDTATEVQAYYLVQIEKTARRYRALCRRQGETALRQRFGPAELEILDEFLAHAAELETERREAARAQRPANVQKLLRAWGGVTIAYRRSMQESPAYIRNHEELNKALEEGLYYAEGLEPKAVRLDQWGHCLALACQRRERQGDRGWRLSEAECVLPARSIFVATGARPNIAYEFEHRGHFEREGFQYQPYHCLDRQFLPLPVAHHCKDPDFGPFTSYRDPEGHHVTFLGDTHPVFHGSVVKAVASAMRSYPHIIELFADRLEQKGDPEEYAGFAQALTDRLQARLLDVIRHAPELVELRVRAPQAANKFQPGQFFRLQNFETDAARVGLPDSEGGDTLLQAEGLALLGCEADKDKGEINLLLRERGASSRLAARLRPGQSISLMGPTGVKSKIYHEGGETLLYLGDSLSVATLRALGPAQRAAGNRVLYIGVFAHAGEAICREALEQASDAIVWISEQGGTVSPGRPGDLALDGEFGEALQRLARGDPAPPIPLEQVTRVQLVGAPRLVRRFNELRSGALKAAFSRTAGVTASIHGPMQCMLKGVCAQCLQWQIDPASGERTKAVFTCSWQDEPLDIVDLDNLDQRLGQNRMQEILGDAWLSACLENVDGD